MSENQCPEIYYYHWCPEDIVVKYDFSALCPEDGVL